MTGPSATPTLQHPAASAGSIIAGQSSAAGSPPREGSATALVLSGGGVLGALQAGLLLPLCHPDAEGARMLVEIWRGLRNRQPFMVNPLTAAAQLLSGRPCVGDNRLLRELILKHAPSNEFADTAVPLYVTATNLSRARKEVFHEGVIAPAVLASTAVPGLFCPIEIDGDLYVDGGLLANLDIETACDAGATAILAIDVSRCLDGRRPASLAAVLLQSLDVVHRQRVDVTVPAVAARMPVTLVQPNPREAFGIGSLRSVDRLLEEGERFGEAAVRLCMRPDGNLVSGTIHGPLHLHPWSDATHEQSQRLAASTGA
jgi:NTE family protein